MAGIYEALNALADSFRTGTKKYLTGTQADMRYLPTLDEALFRLEQYRQGTPVSQAGPGMSVPTATAEDMMAAGLDAVTPMPVGPLQTVFHGTPNKWLPEPNFQLGRPRLDKIGTGEGAQAYGHGIYFAENPTVAQSYMRENSQRGTDEVIGSLKKLGIGQSVFDDDIANFAIELQYQKGDWDKAHKSLRNYRKILEGEGNYGYADKLKKFEAEISDVITNGKTFDIPKGLTYKLDIPDEVIPSLIDWDRPLWDQPKELLPRIKAAFYDLVGDDDRAAELFADAMRRDHRFADHFKGDRGAEALRRHGIPGLSYFDGLSRRAGEGTRNYVIWDQGLLDRITPLDVIQD